MTPGYAKVREQNIKKAALEEEIRSNKANEALKEKQTKLNFVSSLLSTGASLVGAATRPISSLISYKGDKDFTDKILTELDLDRSKAKARFIDLYTKKMINKERLTDDEFKQFRALSAIYSVKGEK